MYIFNGVLIISISLSAFGFVSCSSRQIENHAKHVFLNNDKSTNNEPITRRDSLLSKYADSGEFEIKEKISLGSRSVIIITRYLNDTMDLAYAYDPLRMIPIVISQRVIFTSKSRLENTVHLPFEVVNVKNIRGQSIEVPNVSLWKASTLYTSKDTLLILQASGFCAGNSCPEFIGYYKIDGTVLHQGYVDNDSNYKNILQSYNVSDSAYRSALKTGRILDYFWRN